MSDNFGVIRRESTEAYQSSSSTSSGSSALAIVPTPRLPDVSVRAATMDDLPFIDQLQKLHSHMVGFLHKRTLETYIQSGNVLLAQGVEGDAVTPSPAHPLGYCIFKDQYMKRDDVGIIYQLNVLPLKQRNLIGATLVKATFERAAYGCKLFCCWCAQDIRANWFWESLGFVPLAFRTGSRGKQRIHIFWERRIREGDETTPWWFPYQTQAGAVREDRIVLPIPPETHWRDAKPLVLPDQGADESAQTAGRGANGDGPKCLPGGAPVKPRPEQPKLTAAQRVAIKRAQSAHLKGVPVGKKAIVTGSGIKYVDRTDYVAELDDPDELREEAIKQEKRKRSSSSKPRAKHDPKMIRQARDLRDRYLEEVNERGLLPEAWSDGKYDVSRALEGGCAPGTENDAKVTPVTDEIRLLDVA